MIEIKTVGGGADCRIVNASSPEEVMTGGMACVGALISMIACAGGEKVANAFAKALKEVLEDEEIVNMIIQEGIRARGAAAQ